MTTTAEIEKRIDATMQRISEAAGKRDLPAVAALSRSAAELEEMMKTVTAIEARLNNMDQPIGSASEPESQSVSKLRELPIEVTQGMLNQNLLTLTYHVKQGRIQAGEDMIIEAFPSGERFRTSLLTNGNKLRERGAIGRFYREAGVHADDFVVLKEESPGLWTLKKAPPGKYPGRYRFLGLS